MAFELARRGLDVTVVEAGARWDPTTFEHDELAMFVRAYKQSGLQSTKDHDSLIVQGSTVGGSTVINNAIFLRADLDRVLRGLGRRRRARRARAARGRLRRDRATRCTSPTCRPTSPTAVRTSSSTGARRPASRATSCATTATSASPAAGATTAAATTARPRCSSPTSRGRRRAGRRCSTAAADVEVVATDGRASGVRFDRDGREHAIDADRVVVCAGAIGSSGVLLRSGIDLDGRVGKGLHMLGGLFVTAEMEEPVDGFDGIGLCCHRARRARRS